MLSEVLASLLGCHQEFLLEGSGRGRALSFIHISYNINKLRPGKILMKNGKLTPFFDPKWDEISNLNRNFSIS